MKPKGFHFQTQLVHAGEPQPRIGGAVIVPIFQSSTYEFRGDGETPYGELQYLRLGNTPNHKVLHSKLATLEKGDDAVVMGSGMAAVANTLLAVLASGDHLLAQQGLYGGTHDLLRRVFPSFGITCDLVPGDDPSRWQRGLRKNTKVFYLESITNPLLEIADFDAILDFSSRHRLVTIVDNTFASPVNFRPLELGFDLSVHSGTKYLNGHSDIAAGVVIGNAGLVGKVRQLLNLLGAALDPHACFLLHRGMKTLALRVGFQNQSALELATFLEGHPGVERVIYPGLLSHPHHQRADHYFQGFGGMLSFELKGGVERAKAFLRKVKLPLVAPSLGGVETLATRPATTSHSGLSAQERREMGVSERLIRISVGIEATEDLIEDFDQAIGAISLDR